MIIVPRVTPSIACCFSRLFILLWHFIYTGLFAVTLEDTLGHYRNDLSSNRWVGKESSGIWCYLKMLKLLNYLWDSLGVLMTERRDGSWIFFSLRVNYVGLSDPLSHFGWLESRTLSISQGALCCAELGHWLKVMVLGESCKVLLFVT